MRRTHPYTRKSASPQLTATTRQAKAGICHLLLSLRQARGGACKILSGWITCAEQPQASSSHKKFVGTLRHKQGRIDLNDKTVIQCNQWAATACPKKQPSFLGQACPVTIVNMLVDHTLATIIEMDNVTTAMNLDQTNSRFF